MGITHDRLAAQSTSPVGIFAKISNDEVLTYPNPTSNVLYVELPDKALKAGESADVQIISTMGRIVYKTNFMGPRVRHNIRLNGITPGTYFLKVNIPGNQHYTKKITVLK
jgi:hypothetical protein